MRTVLSTVLVLAAVALGAAVLEGQPKKRVLEAEELIIRDPQGRTRLRLGVEPDTAFVAIFSPEGNNVCTLAHRTADNTVTLDMSEGKTRAPRVLLSALGDGTSQLELYERNGVRSMLTSHSRGAFGLSLYDKLDKLAVGVLCANDGRRGIKLSDTAGNPRASLGLLSDGKPLLRLTGKDGKTREIGPP